MLRTQRKAFQKDARQRSRRPSTTLVSSLGSPLTLQYEYAAEIIDELALFLVDSVRVERAPDIASGAGWVCIRVGTKSEEIARAFIQGAIACSFGGTFRSQERAGAVSIAMAAASGVDCIERVEAREWIAEHPRGYALLVLRAQEAVEKQRLVPTAAIFFEPPCGLLAEGHYAVLPPNDRRIGPFDTRLDAVRAYVREVL